MPAPGHVGNVNPKQEKALEAFRECLLNEQLISMENPPPYQETQLLRFLRARDFNVSAAYDMYVKTQEWKQRMDMDRLYEEFEFTEGPDVRRFGWRMYFHGTDKLGRPIFIQDLSGLDTDKVFSVTTAERIVQNFAVTLEHAVRERYTACTETQGHLVDDNYMVLNVQGIGLSTFWNMKSQLQSLLDVLDNNFPELSGRVQIINAPLLFTTIWNYVKGWLPTQTAAKIDICGTDYLPSIAPYVDMRMWPKHLGGQCTCGQPPEQRACETSDFGPWPKRLDKQRE